MSDRALIGLILGGTLALFLMVVAGCMAMDRASCKAKYADSAVTARWSLLGGCRVNAPGQGWIPAENWRVI